jgi:glutathione synthase
VYFRSGYSPTHYQTEDHWAARELLERSLAIKCPSVDYQLAGVKKVQEVLCEDATLSLFVPDPTDQAKVNSLFACFYSLDVESDCALNRVRMARESPEDFVLKPQREGGGNNYFGQQIIEQLANFETDPEVQARAKSLTLMQRIKPQAANALLLKDGVIYKAETVSELGVYGMYLSAPDEELLNETAGYLLRTKHVGTDEGGVASGFAVLDTPYLV